MKAYMSFETLFFTSITNWHCKMSFGQVDGVWKGSCLCKLPWKYWVISVQLLVEWLMLTETILLQNCYNHPLYRSLLWRSVFFSIFAVTVEIFCERENYFGKWRNGRLAGGRSHSHLFCCHEEKGKTKLAPIFSFWSNFFSSQNHFCFLSPHEMYIPDT